MGIRGVDGIRRGVYKTMKDLLSIHEFSDFSGVSVHSLRHWDKIGILPPMEHNTKTNYRFYSPEQIIGAKFILMMRNLGVPLKTIGEIHHDRNPAKIVRLLEQQRRNLDKEMHHLRECYSIIDTRLALIQNGMHVKRGFHALDGIRLDEGTPTDGGTWIDITTVSVLYHEEQPFIFGPENEWPEGKTSHDSVKDFFEQAKIRRINLHFSIGAYYENLEAFKREPTQHKHFISLDPTGGHVKPAGHYLTGFCVGVYEEYLSLIERLTTYLQEHHLEAHGPVFVTYLHDELCVKERADYLIEVSVAVKEAKKSMR